MSTSHSHKHVYVAIPIDLGPREAQETSSWNSVGCGAAAADVDDGIIGGSRRHPRASPPLKDDPSTPPTTSTSRAFACFASGSLLGILFSMAGFWVQEVYQFTSIFGYSLAWSCLTSVASYLIYYAWTSLFLRPRTRLSEARTSSSVKSEYHFALGVFLGFCLACIVTDVLLRMPLRSILVTVTIAIAWAMVMAYCGTLEEQAELDDNDMTSSVAQYSTQALLLRDRKGAVLPLVIV